MLLIELQARVNQEVARQGFLPFADYLSSSRPFNAPFGGLVVHYIPSVLVIVLPPQKGIYSFILNVEGYAGQFYATAICIGILWLRRSRPDLKRPFKAWTMAIFLRLALNLYNIAAPLIDLRSGERFHATYAIVVVGLYVSKLFGGWVITKLTREQNCVGRIILVSLDYLYSST